MVLAMNYLIKQVERLNKQGNLDIFHANVSGLGSTLDNLHEFLYTTPTKMDILTETLEKEDIVFCIILKLKDMKIIIQLPNHQGWTANYVNNSFDALKCCGLNISNMGWKTTWIEIKNKNSRNIIYGSIYII